MDIEQNERQQRLAEMEQALDDTDRDELSEDEGDVEATAERWEQVVGTERSADGQPTE